MNLTPFVKYTLAFISGVACFGVFASFGEFASPWGEPDTILVALGLYGMSGLLFTLGVLLPYLRRDRWILVRGFALVAVSTLSYRCAAYVVHALSGSAEVPTVVDLIAASSVGALIVILGAKLVIPLNHPRQLVVSGSVAAVLGGLAFSATPLFLATPLFHSGVVLAYGAWHMLMAAAIHFSESRDGSAQTN
ncbi:MAG: hypothetical protein OEY77_13495 [Nitrospira sp.]|nr:hypothetical protein [Nitrospira sp.]